MNDERSAEQLLSEVALLMAALERRQTEMAAALAQLERRGLDVDGLIRQCLALNTLSRGLRAKLARMLTPANEASP
jgi:hypothetical protein